MGPSMTSPSRCSSALEADGFGYETVFLITPHEGTRLDTDEIRTRLDALGESVLVAGDARAVKIHVHNARPDEIFSYGLSLGTLSRIGVENLDRQAKGTRERLETAAATVTCRRRRRQTPVGIHVIAVVAGDGLARVFRTLGAHAIVMGGQSANPSAGELADAIEATGALRGDRPAEQSERSDGRAPGSGPVTRA